MAPPLLPPPACQGQTAKGKSSGKLGGGDSDGPALGRHRLQRRDMAHATKQRRCGGARQLAAAGTGALQRRKAAPRQFRNQRRIGLRQPQP